jgi:hypothetical protein
MDGFYTLQDLSHDPKLAAALGHMVVAWAHAEDILLSAFSRIAGIRLNMSAAGEINSCTHSRVGNGQV